MQERCTARTVKGHRCRQRAAKESEYCTIHKWLECTTKKPLNEDCPICLEPLAHPSPKTLCFECNHGGHKECFKGLRKAECPVCRCQLSNLPNDLKKSITAHMKQDEQRRIQEEFERDVDLAIAYTVHQRHFLDIEEEEEGEGEGVEVEVEVEVSIMAPEMMLMLREFYE